MLFFQHAFYSMMETLGIVFTFIALGILIEFAFRRFARSDAPHPSRWNRIFNCKCALFIVIFQGTVELVLFLPAYWFSFKIAATQGSPFLASRPGIGFALWMALVSSLVGDFLYYWVHRWQHNSRWLWPIHELHHEDENMNVTSAGKFHWLDSITMHILLVVPAIFLPRPLTTIPMLYVLRSARTAFEHLAIPLHFGQLNWLITSPSGHRIHHSKLPEHENSNFAAVWPIWDVLFGTYVAPRGREYPPTGVYAGKVTKSLKEAFWGPLVVAKKPTPLMEDAIAPYDASDIA